MPLSQWWKFSLFFRVFRVFFFASVLDRVVVWVYEGFMNFQNLKKQLNGFFVVFLFVLRYWGFVVFSVLRTINIMSNLLGFYC